MEIPSYFTDFIANIRLTPRQTEDLKTGHKMLKDRLHDDEELKTIIVSTFLQGSYRRSTAIKPKNGERADVDVVVVTNLNSAEYTPRQALNAFKPFMEKHYKGKYRMQGRSIGIELSYVDLDVVVTSAPSEAQAAILTSEKVTSDDSAESAPDWFSKEVEAWRLEPLEIPNREANEWELTHPLEQIRWTHRKNRDCNGRYLDVVRAIRWWRRLNYSNPQHPKGYCVEHIVGDGCPSGYASVADLVTRTLEEIVRCYLEEASQKKTPFLPDRGVPSQNVLKRVTGEEFAEFYAQVEEAAKIARQALESADVKTSADLWRQLFGTEFPAAPDDGGSRKEGFTPRLGPSTPAGGRFA